MVNNNSFEKYLIEHFKKFKNNFNQLKHDCLMKNFSLKQFCNEVREYIFKDIRLITKEGYKIMRDESILSKVDMHSTILINQIRKEVESFFNNYLNIFSTINQGNMFRTTGSDSTDTDIETLKTQINQTLNRQCISLEAAHEEYLIEKNYKQNSIKISKSRRNAAWIVAILALISFFAHEKIIAFFKKILAVTLFYYPHL